MTIALQEHISIRLRETMERRLTFLLKTDGACFVPLACELSLIDLLNGIFLLEGQSETIGAYAGAVKFIVAVVGKEEAWRRPEKAEPKAGSEAEALKPESIH
jgi:hypothetical protein